MYPINTGAILPGVQKAQWYPHGQTQGQSEGQTDNQGYDTCFVKAN